MSNKLNKVISIILTMLMINTAMFASVKFKLEFLPVNNKYLSESNGGFMSDIDAYKDGVGMYFVHKDISNKEMNENIYKHGEIAKSAGMSLEKYMKDVAPELEDLISVVKKSGQTDPNAPIIGSPCNDNDNNTIDDVINEDGLCEGSIIESDKITCLGSEAGSEFIFEGVTYLVVDNYSIRDPMLISRLDTICTSNVTLMDSLFEDMTINGDISQWDTSNVVDMSYMFNGAEFNGDISKWNTSKVFDMSYMFNANTGFNQPIENWDVSRVYDFSYMFNNSDFNQPINKWKPIRGEVFSGMFESSIFDQDISGWEMKNAADLSSMFYMSQFSRDISAWNVESVLNMDYMFGYNTVFNQDLSSWCVEDILSKPYYFNSEFFTEENHPKWGESCNSNNSFEKEDTVTCLDKNVGETFVDKGKTYLVVDNNSIRHNTSYDSVICTSHVTKMNDLFRDKKINMNITGWDVSNVVDMDRMFARYSGYSSLTDKYGTQLLAGSGVNPFVPRNAGYYQDLSNWDTSKVTTMAYMFKDYAFYNDSLNISNFNLINVEDTSNMFNGSGFSGDISSWNVSKVKDMNSMFLGSFFNGNIGNWNVSSVTDMSQMFWESLFNHPIGNWDVSKVENMESMFYFSKFDQPIGNWNVSKVKNMNEMFSGSIFNQPIGDWDISSVTNTGYMFSGAEFFNQPLNNWDTSKVVLMFEMFSFSNFNQPIGDWNTINVQSMDNMFTESIFDQDISKWCVPEVRRLPYEFSSTLSPSFYPIWGTCPN